MIILNFILSFAIILAQLIFLLSISSLIISLVSKTIGKQRKMSLKDALTRKLLVRGYLVQNINITLLFFLFIIAHIVERTYLHSDFHLLLLCVVISMLVIMKSSVESFVYLILSTLILLSVKQATLIKFYATSDWLNQTLDIILIKYSLTLKSISLLFAVLVLKNTFKQLIKSYTLAGLIVSSLLTVFIITENFQVINFPFVLINNAKFESFTRSLMAFGSVFMHYISIYLIIYLYVFVRKRPLHFINQL